MQPENVNPANFTVEQILYNQNNFSIAVGIWQDDGTRRLAMRWNERNGEPDDKGYPSVFQHPMWFQLPSNEDISAVIQTLVDNNPSNQ